MIRLAIVRFAAAWMALLAVLVVSLAGCGAREAGDVLRGATMGTTYTIRLPERPDGSARRALARDVAVRLEALNAALSTYDAGSDLSRFNRAQTTEWVPVPADLAVVAAAAQQVAAMTGGAFDVTVQPLVDLWGFGPAGPRDDVPETADLDAVRDRVGFKRLEARVSPPALRKLDPQLQVDLSAIAKGYAVDELAAVLRAHGHTAWMIEIGGEIRVAGLKSGGRHWQIGVERPGEGAVEIFTTLALTDSAIASSGNYRNFFAADGKRYSHVIEPRTGRPVDYGVGGSTVVHEQAMFADAFATALLVMDPRAAIAFAERHNLAVIMFEAAGTDWIPVYSKAFEAMLTK